MLPVIWLNDPASSPSWSLVVMLMRCVKSPCRTRSVPMKSSWIELVIDRASASPMTSATSSMMRKRTATTTKMNLMASPIEAPCTSIDCASESRRKRSPILNVSATVARSGSPVAQFVRRRRGSPCGRRARSVRRVVRCLSGAGGGRHSSALGLSESHDWPRDLHAGPLVQPVQHGAVERQVGDDPANRGAPRARRPDAPPESTSSGSFGASGSVTASCR